MPLCSGTNKVQGTGNLEICRIGLLLKRTGQLGLFMHYSGWFLSLIFVHAKAFKPLGIGIKYIFCDHKSFGLRWSSTSPKRFVISLLQGLFSNKIAYALRFSSFTDNENDNRTTDWPRFSPAWMTQLGFDLDYNARIMPNRNQTWAINNVLTLTLCSAILLQGSATAAAPQNR